MYAQPYVYGTISGILIFIINVNNLEVTLSLEYEKKTEYLWHVNVVIVLLYFTVRLNS